MNAVKTPEIWQVCRECRGSVALSWSEHGQKMTISCGYCKHSPLPGYRAIPYTPEQWEAAGGVLHERIPVWGGMSII